MSKPNEEKKKLLREVAGFNPAEFVERGLDKDGNDQYYMRAYARMTWFNTYRLKNKKNMFLVAEQIPANDESKVLYHAELKEIVCEEPLTIVTTATGDGTCKKDVDKAHEIAETRAKGRCLSMAGFNVPVEFKDDMVEDGILDAPIMPDLIKKAAVEEEETVTSIITEPVETVKVQEEAEEDVKIPNLASLFPKPVENKKPNNAFSFDANASEEDQLNFCINKCYYPWNQRDFTQGDLIKDICLKEKFVEKLEWILNDYTGNGEIASGLPIKKWAEIMKRYLINSSPADKKVLISVISKK